MTEGSRSAASARSGGVAAVGQIAAWARALKDAGSDATEEALPPWRPTSAGLHPRSGVADRLVGPGRDRAVAAVATRRRCAWTRSTHTRPSAGARAPRRCVSEGLELASWRDPASATMSLPRTRGARRSSATSDGIATSAPCVRRAAWTSMWSSAKRDRQPRRACTTRCSPQTRHVHEPGVGWRSTRRPPQPAQERSVATVGAESRRPRRGTLGSSPTSAARPEGQRSRNSERVGTPSRRRAQDPHRPRIEPEAPAMACEHRLLACGT